MGFLNILTKSSKLIATLGVVAGLGVAALPLGSAFAQETVKGRVEVDVEVLPAIAMTISGNNDTPTHAVYTVASVTTGDPVTGLYEKDGNTYDVTTDTTAQEGKTYYEKADYGVAKSAAPSGATSIDNQTNLATNGYTVGDSPSMATKTSSSWVSILPNAKVEGGHDGTIGAAGFGSTITVYTNNNSGYTLKVSDADADTKLQHTENSAEYIQTGAEAVAAGTAKWNFDTTPGASGAQALTAAAMPANNAPVTIDTFATKTTGGRITYVDYNVSTSADQATGTYTDTIIYTATTN